MLQWTRTRNSDLAKGSQPLEMGPDLWTGNYYADQRGYDQRWHASQSIAWEKQYGLFTHRFGAGGEFDYVNSSLQLDRRGFQLLDSAGDLRSSVSFAGPDFTALSNREYGAFVQDRVIFNPALQMETGLRYDRERIACRNNLAPRFGFSFLPRRTPRSKISGGTGLFYDNITLLNIEMSRLQRRYTTTYDNGARVAAPAPTSVQASPDLRDPYSVHWNIAWENEWAPRWVSRVEYIQKAGRQDARLAAVPLASGFDMLFNNSGKSDFRAVEFIFDRPVRTDLRFLASYTHSNAKARPSMSLDFPDPAVESMGEVPVEWNTTHRFLSWGYFPLPSRLYASFVMEARSGFPFTAVNDLNHVVGTYNGNRMPTFFSTDAGLEKQLPIPFENGKRVAVRIGVTNLFNHFNPRTVDPDINSSNFLRFTDSPRRQLVLRLRILKK
jgi:outer membrane receptor protein involved in Fe transport